MTTRLHIFKAGRQTDMSGRTVDFSADELADAAAAYDPALHEAPIVVGHPATDAPAYGWIKSLHFTDEGLEAEPAQVDPEFAELVTKGRFKKISASFYTPNSPHNPAPGKWYLRHVGFLGAMPPAVKGLKAIAFNEQEDGVVSFGDLPPRTVAGLFRRLRDFFIGQYGQEKADAVLPSYELDWLSEVAAQPEAESRPAFSEPTPSAIPVQPEKEPPVTPEEKAKLEADNQQLRAQLAERDRRDAETARQARESANASFADGLVKTGQLKPADKALVVSVLNIAATPAADGNSVQYGEGAEQKPLVDVLKTFLSAQPKVVHFGEVATKDKAVTAGGYVPAESSEFSEKHVDGDRLDLHRRATSLATEKQISYEQAVRQLITG